METELETFGVAEAAACTCGLSPVPRPEMMPGLHPQGLCATPTPTGSARTGRLRTDCWTLP